MHDAQAAYDQAHRWAVARQCGVAAALLGLVSFPLMLFVAPSLGAIACGLAALHYGMPGTDRCSRILGLLGLTLGLALLATAIIFRFVIRGL